MVPIDVGSGSLDGSGKVHRYEDESYRKIFAFVPICQFTLGERWVLLMLVLVCWVDL